MKSIKYKITDFIYGIAVHISKVSHVNMERECDWRCSIAYYVNYPLYCIADKLNKGRIWRESDEHGSTC